ncbi:MAG: dCMP deaminase family protein [Desulfobacteraceae bacterium]|jgi:dCMP deaminase
MTCDNDAKFKIAISKIDDILKGLTQTEIHYILSNVKSIPFLTKKFFHGEHSVIAHIPRLPRDTYFMLQAALVATRSTCDRGPELFFDPSRHGVGAIIVKDNRMIASGYNGSPPGEPHCNTLECPNPECVWCHSISVGSDFSLYETSGSCPLCQTTLVGGHLMRDGHCQRTLHAEENALLQCAMDSVSPTGGTMYTTASPCWDCAKRIVRVGIKRLVYGSHYDSRYGLSKDACDLLERAGVSLHTFVLR